MIRVWTVEDNASYRRAVIDEINGSQELSCEREFEACEPLLEDFFQPGARSSNRLPFVAPRAVDTRIDG